MTFEELFEHCDGLEKKVVELTAQLAAANGKGMYYQGIIERLRNQLFGKLSEKRALENPYATCRPLLFPVAPTPEPIPEPVVEKKVVIEAHTRVTFKKRAQDKEALEGTFPDHLPRVDEVIDIKPQGVSDEDLEAMGEEITERLSVKPSEHFVVRIVRKKYKIKSEGKIVVAPAPTHVLGHKCMVTAAFIVSMVVDKCLWSKPIYRLQQQLRLDGINISRDSLVRWYMELANLFKPIVAAITMDIRGSPYAHIDETFIKVFRKALSGPQAESEAYLKSYLWPILAPEVGVTFTYSATRSLDGAKSVLGDFRGTIVSDAYAAYDSLSNANKIVWQLCWMHIRRNFVEAEISNPERAKEAISYIQKLYRVEHDIKELEQERGKKLEDVERLLYRQNGSVPVLEEMHKWLISTSNTAEYATSPSLKKAVGYVLGRWDAACLFTKDGALPLDNGMIERAIRTIKIGAKNWMHCASEGGAGALATYYSLIGSCLMHGIHPYYYLLDLTTRIEERGVKAEDLTPARWKIKYADQAIPKHARNTILPGEAAIGGPRSGASLFIQ